MLAGFCYLTESATCNVSWIVMALYLQGRVHQHLFWALGVRHLQNQEEPFGFRHRVVGCSFGQFGNHPLRTMVKIDFNLVERTLSGQLLAFLSATGRPRFPIPALLAV